MRKLVIVPVYNEAPTLDKVITRIKMYHSGDILAIDDGSSDGSEHALDKIDDLLVMRHAENAGYGQSLIDGFNFAIDGRYDLVITIDCDEQHEPCMIPKMFKNIGELDVLSGSRYLENNFRNNDAPADRKQINVTITQIMNQALGLELTDSFCGFKCYRTSALEKLKLTEPGYAMPIQFWVQAKYFELNVGEIAVPRIYKSFARKFGGNLDEPDIRLDYYKRILQKELDRWSMPSLSEHIPTT